MSLPSPSWRVMLVKLTSQLNLRRPLKAGMLSPSHANTTHAHGQLHLTPQGRERQHSRNMAVRTVGMPHP